MSNNTNHITFARQVDLIEGRLTASERAEVEPHLSTCARCAADAAWLDRVIGLMRTDATEEPPPHVAAAAKRLFQPALASARRQLTAALQFDSARSLATGMRAATATERQMLFAVAGYLLDLRIASSDTGWVISGQLLGADHCNRVELHGSAGILAGTVNSLSEFALPPTPSGHYSLIVQLSDLDIRIAGIEL